MGTAERITMALLTKHSTRGMLRALKTLESVNGGVGGREVINVMIDDDTGSSEPSLRLNVCESIFELEKAELAEQFVHARCDSA